MKIFRIFGTIAIIIFFSVQLNSEPLQSVRTNVDTTQFSQNGERTLQVGEELQYSVHYSFFNIGTILFKVISKELRSGREVYHAAAFMDSNPSLSWLVDLHVRFYSEIDQDAFSYGWINEDSTSNSISYRKMSFDYVNHKMYYVWGKKLPSGELIVNGRDTVPITKNCQDGLSLFYYAREHSNLNKQVKIPTFIDTNEVMTTIRFGAEKTEEEIDSVSYPIDVVQLKGRADFVGVFGLTGAFEGLFTNDAARIPVTARLKVILGSIKVELQKWKRDNWMPPKYEEKN